MGVREGFLEEALLEQEQKPGGVRVQLRTTLQEGLERQLGIWTR